MLNWFRTRPKAAPCSRKLSGACFECTLAAAAMLAMAGAQAQAQSESAHPPSAVAASPGEPRAAPANRLRSVLISPGRKLAIIDGITVPLGGMVGGARLVRITDTEVLLKTGTETEVLKLFPGTDKRPSTQGAARARQASSGANSPPHGGSR